MSTAIQWTDRVWNPVVGCTKVSQGCKHCYAKTLHDMRHKAFLEGKLQNIPQYAEPFETVQMLPERMHDPLRWRKPARVFVNSMSDLFHDDVPDLFIDQVFATMARCDGTRSNGRRHIFQVLTKRAARALAYLSDADTPYRVAAEVCMHAVGFRPSKGDCDWHPEKVWPLPNVWLGVSVENQATADERIPLLLDTPAAVRFLSCEPLLGALDITPYIPSSDGFVYRGPTVGPVHVHDDPSQIDWVIVGGESGRGARPFSLAWARDIVRQCRAAGVAPFVKQLGAKPWCDVSGISHRGNTARMPDGFYRYLNDQHGGDWNEWPEDLRVREFPGVTP